VAPRQPRKAPARTVTVIETAQPAQVLRHEAIDPDAPHEIPLGPSREIVRVLPSRLWRSSAITAMNAGAFDIWASKVLVDGTYEIWQEVDPNAEEIGDFLIALKAVDGLNPLGSVQSRLSSTPTRRR
jgi:hypothetical protein